MKSFSRLARKLLEKRRRATGEGPPPGAPRPAAGRRLAPWARALLWLALSAGATFAAFELLSPTRLPPALRGTWVVVEGDLKGASLEFFRDGTLIGKVKKDGERRAVEEKPREEILLRGQVRLHEDTLHVTTEGPGPGGQSVAEQRILDLTESQLVLEDEAGELLILRRTP